MLWQIGKLSGTFVAVVFFAFSMTDMVLSLAAFVKGVPEGNPVMAWLLSENLFVPGKVLFTALVAGLIAWYYPRRSVRAAAWLAVALMGLVNAYHVWGLSVL